MRTLLYYIAASCGAALSFASLEGVPQSNQIENSKEISPLSDAPSFRYRTFGGLFPHAGMGYRKKFDGWALDSSGSVYFFFIGGSVTASCAALKYIDKNNSYVGGKASLTLATSFARKARRVAVPFPSIGIVLGRETTGGRFYQLNVSGHIIKNDNHRWIVLPIPSYEFGITF